MTENKLTFDDVLLIKNLHGYHSKYIYPEFGLTVKERAFLAFGYMCELEKGFFILRWLQCDYSLHMVTVIKWCSSLQDKGLVYEFAGKTFNGVTGFPKKMRLTEAGKDKVREILKFVKDKEKQRVRDIVAPNPAFNGKGMKILEKPKKPKKSDI
jgi:hypothetical protein